MTLIASLPWYDIPNTTDESLDIVWAVLRSRLADAGIEQLPCALNRAMPVATQWATPNLIISQSCGLDLFAQAGTALEPIAAPVFAKLDCAPGNYFSHIVTANPGWEQPTRVVINSPSSRSGCTALFEWLAANDYGQPDEIIVSGSHEASLRMLNNGLADVGAIDAHSFELLGSDGIAIIGRTAEAPAPPFVTHRDNGIDRTLLFDALSHTMAHVGHLIGVAAVVSAEHTHYHCLKQDAQTMRRIEMQYQSEI